MKALAFVCLLCAASLAGCGDHAASPAPEPDMLFDSGEFDVTSTLVEDGCLDGGLNLLFMPNGQTEPWKWPYPIMVYGPGNLPQTYAIQLRDPFGPMTVTATPNGGAAESFAIDSNPSVLLDEANYGQCVVDMGGSVALSLIDEDHVEGVANLAMSDPRGDDRCPVGMPVSCAVRLQFEGQRVGSK